MICGEGHTTHTTHKTHRTHVLVGGGARSGKSAFALDRARRLGERRVLLATAQGFDDEMRARIELHRRQRGDDFRTIEEPVALAAAFDTIVDVDVVVIDCLTLWISNLLVSGAEPSAVEEEVRALGRTIAHVPFHVIMVTNEVGMGIVPEHRLGRIFRDVCGRAHQRFARSADEVYIAMLGMILRLKPPPVTPEDWRGVE